MSAAAGMRLRSQGEDGADAEPATCGADTNPSVGFGAPDATCGAAWGEENNRERGRAEAAFECNICLDLATEPVVTQCGHLYCWPCIYTWLNAFRETQQCPMCKAGVCEALLIPLYGRGVRGSDSNRRKNLGGKEKVPNRPKGLRVPSDDPRLSRVREDVGLMADLDLVGERLSGWGSNTASLFFIGGGPAWMPYSRGAHFPISMSPQQQHHVFLSRLLLLLGSFVILCLLIF